MEKFREQYLDMKMDLRMILSRVSSGDESYNRILGGVHDIQFDSRAWMTSLMRGFYLVGRSR